MPTKIKPAMMDITDFAKSLLDDTDASTARATLGANDAGNLSTGTISDARLPDTITSNISGNSATATKLATARTINGVAFDGTANIIIADDTKQPADATLTALAGLTTGADKLVYFTGVDVASTTTLTSFARTLLDDADAATMRSTLGVNNASNLNTGTVDDALLPAIITSDITGNSATATKLATARTISGVPFDGTADIIVPADSYRGTYKNLKIVHSATTPVTSTITFDLLEVATTDKSAARVISSGSVSLSGNGAGLNKHDTAAISTAKWVYLYIVYNPTTTAVGGLYSDSPTTPTLPSGFTMYRRVGAVYCGASGVGTAGTQIDNYHDRAARLNVLSASGASGATLLSWIPGSIPSTAKRVELLVSTHAAAVGAVTRLGPSSTKESYCNVYSNTSADTFMNISHVFTNAQDLYYYSVGTTATVSIWLLGWYENI